jgi:carboxymethylenebutenolidase
MMTTTPQCCEKPPMLNPIGGEGKVADSFGGLRAYVADTVDSEAAIILISGVFGTCF